MYPVRVFHVCSVWVSKLFDMPTTSPAAPGAPAGAAATPTGTPAAAAGTTPPTATFRGAPPPEKITVDGTEYTVLEGKHAAEDTRYIRVLERKPNGTRLYYCVGCKTAFTGAPARVVAHLLQRTGSGVGICSQQPSPECKEAMLKLEDGSRRGAKAARVAGAAAVNGSRTIDAVFGTGEAAAATCDRQLATFVATNDLSFNIFDCRGGSLWVPLVKAIQAAGPLYVPCSRLVLSSTMPPTNGARAEVVVLSSDESESELIIPPSCDVDTEPAEGSTEPAEGSSAMPISLCESQPAEDAWDDDELGESSSRL